MLYAHDRCGCNSPETTEKERLLMKTAGAKHTKRHGRDIETKRVQAHEACTFRIEPQTL
jgi:hypothetical protein